MKLVVIISNIAVLVSISLVIVMSFWNRKFYKLTKEYYKKSLEPYLSLKNFYDGHKYIKIENSNKSNINN